MTPPKSPHTATKSPNAFSRSSAPSNYSDYTPVDDAPEQNIVRRRSKVFESGNSSIASEKQYDSPEIIPVTRIIVSEKVKAFNEKIMGNTPPTDKSDVPEVQVTRSAVAEKAKLFDRGLHDNFNDNLEISNSRQHSKNKKGRSTHDRSNKSGPGSVDTNYTSYTNYTNYNFESPDASISRSIVSERLKIFNGTTLNSPKAADNSKSSKFKSSSSSISLHSLSRDIESTIITPPPISGSKVRAVVDTYESTRMNAKEIIAHTIETPTINSIETIKPIDNNSHTVTTADMMISNVIASSTPSGKIVTKDVVKIAETIPNPIGKPNSPLVTVKQSPMKQQVQSTPTTIISSLDQISPSGLNDKISASSTTTSTIKPVTIKPLIKPTLFKPIASKLISDAAGDEVIPVPPVTKLSPVKNLVTPVDKPKSDVVQPNERPSSDTNKPTVIKRFEKISTTQTQSTIAAATTTTTTTTISPAKGLNSRISKLSSVKDRIEGIVSNMTSLNIEATQ